LNHVQQKILGIYVQIHILLPRSLQKEKYT